MQTKLFVRNLSLGTTSTQLRDAFTQYGEVVSAELATDKFTGEARGFGFVEMKTQVEAEAAMRSLNMRILDGRQIFVSLSDPNERGPRRSGRRGR